MKLNKFKDFVIEVDGVELKYEIINDDVELLINSKLNFGDATESLNYLVNNIQTLEHTEVLNVKQNITKSCIAIINIFLGKNVYQQIREDLFNIGKKTLTTNEHVVIANELIETVKALRIATLQCDIDEVSKYD